MPTPTRPVARALVLLGACTLFACRPAGRTAPSTEMPRGGAEGAPADARFEGELVGRITGTEGRPFGIGVSSEGEVLVLQLDTRSASRVGPDARSVAGSVAVGDDPIDVTFTRDGRRALLTMLSGSRVHEVDVERGRTMSAVGVGSRHHRIALSADERAYYLLSMDGEVSRVSRATSAIERTASLDAVLRGIARHPGNGTLAVAGGDAVWLLDGRTLEVRAHATVGEGTQEIVYSPDGSRLFVALEYGGTILALDARTLGVVDSVRMTLPRLTPFGMALADGGRSLIVSSPSTGVVGVFDTRPLRVRRLVPVGGTPRRIALSPDGRSAYVANERGWVDIIR